MVPASRLQTAGFVEVVRECQYFQPAARRTVATGIGTSSLESHTFGITATAATAATATTTTTAY